MALSSPFLPDPHGFLDAVKAPTILDEVQNVPEVFALVRARIDGQPRLTGRWLLTGSQEAPLMQGVTESMAGRAAPMQRLAEALRNKRSRGTTVEMFLVHQRPKTPVATRAVAPGVQALAWQDFVSRL